MMTRLSCLLVAFVSILSGIFLLLHSLSSPRWISGCVSLASLLLVEKPDGAPIGSDSDLRFKTESVKLLMRQSGSFVMDQQFSKEKDWLNTNLNDKKVCFTQGFFSSCMYGDAFLRFGKYHACIGTDGQGRKWNDPVSITISALVVSACASGLSFAVLAVALRIHCTRESSRAVDVIRYVTSVFTFLSGTFILLGLLPIAALAIAYSSNATNFYNDMIDRIGAAYFFEMRVNWAVSDGELTGAQAWARNIVGNVISLGLDRDFFFALAAGICSYVACASLLIRSTPEQAEKYPAHLYGNDKQS